MWGLVNLFDSLEKFKRTITILKSLERNIVSTKNSKCRPSPQVSVINGIRIKKRDDAFEGTNNMLHHFCKGENIHGKLEEGTSGFISTYKEASGDYSFTSEKYLKYLRNLFDDEAKRSNKENI